MLSHTKHIGVKYHWLRSKVKPYVIVILRIGTVEQRTNIFTKGFKRREFEQT